jgi:hypothetical protein
VVAVAWIFFAPVGKQNQKRKTKGANETGIWRERIMLF